MIIAPDWWGDNNHWFGIFSIDNCPGFGGGIVVCAGRIDDVGIRNHRWRT